LADWPPDARLQDNSDFRKDNGEAIRKVCREFVVLCRRLELLSEASVAIDGSKFKAVKPSFDNVACACKHCGRHC
jgi:transposase